MTSDELRREIAASRHAIQQDYSALCGELDFATKTKRAVVEHPMRWLGGAAFIGYLLSGRKKDKPVKRKSRGREEAIVEPAKKLSLLGVLFAALRLGLPFARPALTAFATRKLADFANSRFQR